MAAGHLNCPIQAKSKEFFDASNSSHRHITQFALRQELEMAALHELLQPV